MSKCGTDDSPAGHTRKKTKGTAINGVHADTAEQVQQVDDAMHGHPTFSTVSASQDRTATDVAPADAAPLSSNATAQTSVTVAPGKAVPSSPEATAQTGGGKQLVAQALKTIMHADLAVTPAELDYIPEELLECVVDMLNFADQHANCYGISMVPIDAAWGVEGDGINSDRYLCFNGTPVTTWLVGIVTSVWLMPSDGNRASIGIKLLCERDVLAARHLQFGMASPTVDALKFGMSFFANRFLGSRGESGIRFSDVYNAEKVMLSWSNMPSVNPARVQKTDVVLVECNIKHYRKSEDKKNGNTNNKHMKGRNVSKVAYNGSTWKNWAISFELSRIAHLFTGPGVADFIPANSNIRF